MSLWARLRGFFADGMARKSAGGLLASFFGGGMSPRRGTRELLQAYRTHPWLHAVVHRIAYEIGQQHFELYSNKRRGKRSMVRSTRASVGYQPSMSTEVESHPFLDLLSNPNPVMTAGTFTYLLSAYLDTKGEVPIVVERGANGEPIELWPVPPHWLSDLPHAASPSYKFSFMSWQRSIPEDDVIYMRHPDLENPYARGVGVAETLADELDVDEFATKHLKGWFFNRAMPDVFLSVEGVTSEAEARRYEEVIRNKYNGMGKASQFHVTNGKVDLKQVGLSFRDQQLPELRSQERDIILQVFSMPPEAMGIIENSNRATIDAAYYLLAKGVLAPRLSFLADAWTSFVRSDWGDERLSVGFHSPVPEDNTFKLSVFTAQPSLFTKNEWRELGGSEPIEGWDEEFPEAPSAFGGGFGAPGLGDGGTPPPPEPPPPAEGEEDEEDIAATIEEGLRRALPSRTRAMSDADVQRVANALQPKRLERVTSEVVKTVEDWGQKTLDELGVSAKFDIRNPLVTEYLDAWREQRIDGITEATRDDVTDILQEAVRQGVGIDEAKRRLRGYFASAADYRAERIARTEVVSSSNAANLAAYEISGLVMSKEWLSVHDSKTRDTHREMDGQRRGIKEPFQSPSGARASGPGLFGVPGEDINCRCTLVPVVDDKAALEGEARAVEWRKYDARLLPYQRAIRDAAIDTFGDWASDAVGALG